jgi:hypothetical protein
MSETFWGRIHNLKTTSSAFQRLLEHTFLTPAATVMGILVQSHVELAVC